MANEDLQIKLVMDLVNNMSGKLDQAARDLGKVTQAMDLAQKQAQTAQIGMKGSLFNPNTWSVLLKDSELLERRMNQLRSSGLEKMAIGAALLAPVGMTVKAAGDLEEIMNQIKVDVFDSSDSTEEWERKVKLLRDTTVGLSREVRYGATEIGQAVDELARGNVKVEDIAKGAARAAVYLAQASKGDVSTAGAAEAVAKLGNAWQLTGKEIEDVADTLARVDAASIASIPSLLEGFKYVGATASNLDLTIRETAVALGVLNNAGLDGSTAGTTLNQMLQHLQPTTKAATDMFEALGLSVENNPFFDEMGKMKPLVEIIKIMRNATKDLTDQQKQLAFKSIFDERGSRAVITLLKDGQGSFEETEQSLDRQLGLWDRIKQQNQGLNAQVDLLKGNVTTLFAESGSPLGEELTKITKRANEAVVAFTEWSKQNPETAKTLLYVAGAGGLALTAIGGLAIAVGTITKGLAPLVAAAGWIARVAGPGVGALGVALEPVLPFIGPLVMTHYDGPYRKTNEAVGREFEDRMMDTVARRGLVEPQISPISPFLEELIRSNSSAPAAGPIEINIYARGAQEAAQEVKRVLDRPASVRYQQSRMPYESFVTQE